MLAEIYKHLDHHYNTLDPHSETWNLWISKEKNSTEIFEVAAGTILVQNTNWINVNKAISNLRKSKQLSFDNIINIEIEELENLVKPAGFYKQKAKYLKNLSKLLKKYSTEGKLPSRQELLKCKGVGKETADSILVYCFYQPIPIVGTYQKFTRKKNQNKLIMN